MPANTSPEKEWIALARLADRENPGREKLRRLCAPFNCKHKELFCRL
jgi:hypothetical protein